MKIKLLILLFVASFNSLFSQSIKITAFQITQNISSCNYDTLSFKIKNDTTIKLINHKIRLTFTANQSYIDTFNVIGKKISISGTTYKDIIIDTLRVGDSISFKIITFFNCSSIPNAPPTNQLGTIIANTDSFKITFLNASSINYNGGLQINNINANNYFFKTVIDYPYIINNLTSTINYSSNGNNTTQFYGSKGDVFTRRVVYNNTGTSPFKGRFVFKDVMNCTSASIVEFRLYIGSVIIDSISKQIISPSPIIFSPTISGNTYSFATWFDSISKIVYPLGSLLGVDSSQIIIEEKVSINSCLGNGCTSTMNINWGCNMNNSSSICKTTIPASRSMSISRYTVNNFKISRLLPTANYNSSSYDFYWNNKCMNDTNRWEFLIQNLAAGMTVYNAQIVLNNSYFRSYTYIEKNSIKINYINSYTGNLTVIPLDSITVKYDTLTQADFDNNIPQCLNQFSIPIQKVTIIIPKMKAGDKLLVSFISKDCCPNDSFLFNTAKIFNHWDIYAKGFSDCATDSFYAVSYRNTATTPPLYSTGFWNTPHISNHFYDSGSDLDLKQLFQPSVTDLTGPAGGGCSPNFTTFDIYNLELTGGLADQQLFYDNVTYGLNGIGQGLNNPHGKFKVEFKLQQGLQILPANYSSLFIFTPTIIWRPYSINQSGTTVTAYFDIDSLPASVRALTGENFNIFFTSTKIRFPINACCPAPPTSTCEIFTYFNPKTKIICNDCWIPMAKQSMKIHVHCPGCITPGIIVNNASLIRKNLGYRDTNDDGFTDNPPTLITPAYSRYNDINIRGSIIGDTLQSIVNSNFVDGDNTNPINNGFTYNQWQTYWNSHGYSNIEYKQLSFEQKIPNSNVSAANLQILTDTFFILQSGGSLLSFPLNINNSNIVKRIGDVYLHKINIDTMRSIFGNGFPSFLPNDLYRFSSTFRVNGNISNVTQSDNVDYMYFTVNPISNPSFNSLPISGDYYKDHHQVAPTISNPDSLPPSVAVIYQCESNGCRHYFYPVKRSLSIIWNDTTGTGSAAYSCTKNVQAKVTAWIDGDIQNAFPYEYRTVPGFNLNNPKKGLLSTSINGIYYKAYLPTGYSLIANQTYTDVYRYYTNSNKVQTRCFSDVLGQWINTSFNSATQQYTYSFKDTFNHTINSFTYPKGTQLNIATTTFGSPPFYNIGKFGVLLGGDERFEQTLRLHYQISCSNGPDTTILNDTMIAVYVNSLDIADSTPVKLIASNTNAIFTKPKPTFSFSNSVYNITTTNVALSKTVTVANAVAENTFMYIDTTQLPACFSLDSIKAGSTKLSPITNSNYKYFKIGALIKGNTTLIFYGHLNCCIPTSPNPYKDYNIKYYLGWNCDSFPSIVPVATNACTSPITDTLKLRFFDAAFAILTNQITQPTNFYSCDTLQYSFCVQSQNSGVIKNNSATIQLPANLNYLTNSITVSVGTSAAVSIPTGYITMSGNSLNINLGFPKMDTLLGNDGFNGTEKICISFKLVPNCLYNGTGPIISFRGIKYCGDSITSFYNFNNITSLGNHCLVVSTTVQNNTCNGNINLNILKGQPPITYHWSNGAFTQNLIGVPAGSYTVTVNGAIGCSVTASAVVIADTVNANFTSNAIPHQCNSQVSFVSTQQTGTHYWKFESNATSTAVNPTHNFTTAGTYPILHQVTNSNGCTTDYTENIIIDFLSDATFSIVGITCGDVELQANDPHGDHYWDFGDGQSDIGDWVTHTYTTSDTFTITHTVIENGCTAIITQSVIINIPNASFSYNSLCSNPTVFTSAFQQGSHSWTFGDGQQATAVNPTHSYAAAGSYAVTHTVILNGCTTTTSQLLNISVSTVNATFTSAITSGNTVSFSSLEQNGTHLWGFGDGSTSTLTNPQHTYAANNTYTVTHTVILNGCTTILQNTINFSANLGICPDVIDLFDYLNEHIYPTRTYPADPNSPYYINSNYYTNKYGQPVILRDNSDAYNACCCVNYYTYICPYTGYPWYIATDVCWANPVNQQTGFVPCNNGTQTTLPQWKSSNIELNRVYFERYNKLNWAEEHFRDCNTAGDSYMYNGISLSKTNNQSSCMSCNAFNLFWFEDYSYQHIYYPGQGYFNDYFGTQPDYGVIKEITHVSNIRIDLAASNMSPNNQIFDFYCLNQKFMHIRADITKRDGSVIYNAGLFSSYNDYPPLNSTQLAECENLNFLGTNYPLPSSCSYPDANFSYTKTGLTASFTSNTPTGIHFWDFGDGSTSTVANPTHTFAANDTFQIIHTVSNTAGCKKSKYGFVYTNSSQVAAVYKKEQSTDENTNITDSDSLAETTVALYPNPTKNTVNIRFNTIYESDYTITLLNSLSQTLIEQKGKATAGGSYIDSIHLASFARGNYTVIVKMNDTTYRFRVIKD